MMVEDSSTVRPPSTSTGIRFTGQSAAHASPAAGSSGPSSRYANAVAFS